MRAVESSSVASPSEEPQPMQGSAALIGNSMLALRIRNAEPIWRRGQGDIALFFALVRADESSDERR